MCRVRSCALRVCAQTQRAERKFFLASNARAELRGNAMRATEATKRLPLRGSKGKLTEPDTMSMVPTDEARGIGALSADRTLWD